MDNFNLDYNWQKRLKYMEKKPTPQTASLRSTRSKKTASSGVGNEVAVPRVTSKNSYVPNLVSKYDKQQEIQQKYRTNNPIPQRTSTRSLRSKKTTSSGVGNEVAVARGTTQDSYVPDLVSKYDKQQEIQIQDNIDTVVNNMVNSLTNKNTGAKGDIDSVQVNTLTVTEECTSDNITWLALSDLMILESMDENQPEFRMDLIQIKSIIGNTSEQFQLKKSLIESLGFPENVLDYPYYQEGQMNFAGSPQHSQASPLNYYFTNEPQYTLTSAKQVNYPFNYVSIPAQQPEYKSQCYDEIKGCGNYYTQYRHQPNMGSYVHPQHQILSNSDFVHSNNQSYVSGCYQGTRSQTSGGTYKKYPQNVSSSNTVGIFTGQQPASQTCPQYSSIQPHNFYYSPSNTAVGNATHNALNTQFSQVQSGTAQTFPQYPDNMRYQSKFYGSSSVSNNNQYLAEHAVTYPYQGMQESFEQRQKFALPSYSSLFCDLTSSKCQPLKMKRQNSARVSQDIMKSNGRQCKIRQI